ncbi:MAG: YchF family ATPase [Lentisphaerae bacterium]|nr:YchF family ATPase [Lentisphaerota bacterium]
MLGYSQAGKRTLFTLLTGRKVPEGRKDSETVEGLAPVRDPRVDKLAEIAKPEKTTYAEVRFALCPDVTTTAERLWLEPAKRADALCGVVRAFEDASVYHPYETVDPARDRSNIETEIVLADLEMADKRIARLAKERRGGGTPAQELEHKALEKCVAALGSGQWLRDVELSEQELVALRSLGFLTLKPMLWIRNVGEQVIEPGGGAEVTIAGRFESEIAELESVEERRVYLRDLGVDSLGVDRLNAAAYDVLGLMSFYTMGPDEVRAWTIRKGARAPEAGGRIHTDIERGFIRVEVIQFEDLVKAGSEAAVKAKGQVQLRGRDYVLQDGDICHFLFNV